jgi:hypothetical protein
MMARASVSKHDLHDAAIDLEDPGPLGEYLRLCRDHLIRPFEEADREALSSQAWHRGFTGAAAGLGGSALVLSALNIAFHGILPTWLLMVEAVLAAVATVFVLAGIVRGWHGEWLLRRYQAEQLRLAKFRFLVDPEFWCEGGPTGARTKDRFLREIERIRAIEEKELDALAADEGIPRDPSEAACGAITDALRLEILAYYRRRRLESQLAYFSNAGRRKPRWYQSPALLPSIFFASIVCVVLHVWAVRAGESAARREHPVLEAPGRGREERPGPDEPNGSRPLDDLARIALALSLGLPGAWAGIRTWRTANEFGRNHARSLARFKSLSKVAERISPAAPVWDVFADLGLAEHILESDQGEWLRLMREAEWYG